MNTDCASVTIPASVKEIKEHEACNNFMFCGVFGKESGALERPLTLIVEKDSFAEKYAKENNIKYKTVNISMPYPYNLISCIFGERGYGDGVILNADLMMTIESLTLRFSEEEKNVFCMFFIYGYDEERVAANLPYDATKEDAHVIIAKILRRLRHPTRSRLLKPFLVNSGIEECFEQEE